MNQFTCPNIVCVDKDGDSNPTTTCTVSAAGPVSESAQPAFPFMTVQISATQGYTFPAITEPGSNISDSASK